MAFVNKQGLNISFACDDLIEELKEDISEFGEGLQVEVITFERYGVKLYGQYNFVDDNDTRHAFKLKPNEKLEHMTAGELLRLYEQQDEPIL